MLEPSQTPSGRDPDASESECGIGPLEGLAWGVRGELRVQSLPTSLGSEMQRGAIGWLLDTSLRLSADTRYRGRAGADERSFLEIFAGRVGTPKDVGRQSLMLLVNSPDLEPLRRDFLEQVASIALRCTARRDEPSGCVPALRLVFEHHPQAELLIHRAFQTAVMPDNRCGIARVAGEVMPSLQRELFESLFDTYVQESEAFRVGMIGAEGLAMCALQFQSSLSLLRRVEPLFDQGSPAYETALAPLRQEVGRDLDYLIARDKGRAAVEVMRRFLTEPLTVEERAAVVEPMMYRIGANKVSPEVVVSFVAIPAIRAWLASDESHSECLHRPTFINQPIVRELFSEIVREISASSDSVDAVRPLFRMVRYLGRVEAGQGAPLIWADDLTALSEMALASGELGLLVYREMMSSLVVRAKGCSMAMQSIFAYLAKEDIPPTAVDVLQGVMLEAVGRFPEVVLAEAGRFHEPEKALRWVVDSLMTSGEGADRRARQIVDRWRLTLREDQAEFLFWEASLSRDQRNRAAAALADAIAAAYSRITDPR